MKITNYNIMTKFIRPLSTAFFLLICGTTIKAQDTAPYIIPVDQAGKPVDTERVQMTAVDSHYELNGVEISTGFVFAGISATETSGTYYSLSSWAVKPPVFGLPNPLSISTGSDYIAVEPGKYDFKFYSRSLVSAGNHQFTIVPTDQQGAVFYPQRLFLISGGKVAATLEGTDGVYEIQPEIPASFQISYEPKSNEAIYVYGPEDGNNVTLAHSEEVSIALNKGTSATISVPRTTLGKLTISLTGEKPYVMYTDLIQTGVSALETPSDEARYYTLQGIPVQHMPQSGIFIEVRDGKATKHVYR